MYEFQYDYVKPKYGEKVKLCYMDTENFIVYIKTDDPYKNIARDVETIFDNSNYELDRPLPKGKNETGIELTEGEKIMTEFVRLRAKIYSYLIDDGSEDKKAKGTKKYVIRKNLNLKMIKTVQKQLNLLIK